MLYNICIAQSETGLDNIYLLGQKFKKYPGSYPRSFNLSKKFELISRRSVVDNIHIIFKRLSFLMQENGRETNRNLPSLHLIYSVSYNPFLSPSNCLSILILTGKWSKILNNTSYPPCLVCFGFKTSLSLSQIRL